MKQLALGKPSFTVGRRQTFAFGGKRRVPAWQIIQSILSPNGEDYAFFDFMDSGRRFVENTGPTPAANAGDAMGLVIDRAKQGDKTLREAIAAMPEKVANGGFDTASNWAMTATSTISGGKLHMNAEPSNGNVLQSGNGFVIGRLYAVTYEVSNYVAGQFRLQIEASVGPTRTGNGVFTDYLSCFNTNARIFVRSVSTLTCDIDNISIREVPAHYAAQASGSLKPSLQGGAKFDGADDSLLTDWTCRSGANCIIAQVDFPANVSSFRYIAGCYNGSNDRFALGLDANGRVCGSIGTQSTPVIFGGSDLRGRSCVVAIVCDGSTVRLFNDTGLVYSAGQDGSPSTARAAMIGAMNNTGSGGSFFGGTVKQLAFGYTNFTEAQFQQIRSAWRSQ
ncbi:hypothetical protein [Rhizobium rhizogenes]|uniref:LamG domain-containing protein n=1 Tax=Rhizobium rhizogenes TaxID=359 RepID=A0AA92HAC6_RHIRH|nr:hypothetical protein [Rhizobium rhizogenes]PVE56287.1 hypothetical protein DC430_00285 [Rhizobium rhizogenes]PVE64782.1 hypothetical protein DC415_13485 [Agrobacterium tumefaciens]PVE73920.1 hypothetical protein DCP16_13485 [Sphingomonas sp. TPD3009]